MPELPEVTTTVNGLQRVLLGLTILDVWTDLTKKNQKVKQFEETIKNEKFYKKFRQKVINKKIISVERRAKNILINISGGQTILIHLKMTGHLLFGEYKKVVSRNKKVERKIKWIPKVAGPLNDPYNRFIHFVFSLSNGKHVTFSDSRKFGKITLIPNQELKSSRHLMNIGPEPLEKTFTKKEFAKRLLLKPNWKIKTVLMDQKIIAGIGNIYSDEILWSSNIHPESNSNKIPATFLHYLYKNMKILLKKGINLGGDSMSDYRNIYGEKGDFQNYHNVYRKSNTKCVKKNCSGVIIRKVINGRSSHFCNKHQKLFINNKNG
jgi:formamidopyrimidine-DNA glycosylase